MLRKYRLGFAVLMSIKCLFASKNDQELQFPFDEGDPDFVTISSSLIKSDINGFDDSNLNQSKADSKNTYASNVQRQPNPRIIWYNNDKNNKPKN